jgi:imidazolonepropionase-like amidohydrolase
MRGERADPIARRERIVYLRAMTDADYGAAQEGVAMQKTLVRMLHESGAPMLVGTDRMPWGYAFHWELEQLVDAGLSPWDVLRAATLDAARYLGQDSTSGSVTQGKRADLVLLDANPLDDMRNSTRIAGVVARGRLFEAAELTAMKEAACAELESPPAASPTLAAGTGRH